MSIHQMFDLTFSPQEKNTIDHIARFWEPRVRDFAPSIYLDHYTNTKAICDEIAEIKRHYSNYFKGISHMKEYRMKLVTSFNLQEIYDTLDYIQDHADEFTFI